MKLHEITSNIKEIATIEDVPPEAIADTLEAAVGDFDDKAKSIAAVSMNLNSNIASIDAEIARLNKRKAAIVNSDKSLREYLKFNMIQSGIKKISCELFTITLVAGRDVLQINDEDAIPDEYMAVKTEVKPDKKRLLSDLKQGVDIPACEIVKSDHSVRIK